ncbi:MAG: hypothetical protein Unbinned92contig1002_4 [Prokaryotic dsDNA virus sp.]|nr:MAG: hypothetical protein Unbinned92contig1002_4 [Prokaryotic dsDNA virus sp.]
MDYRKAVSWCLENDIKIYVKPIRQGKRPPVIIVIDFKGQIKKGKIEYEQNKKIVWEKINEIYKTYYSLYNL